MYGGDKQACIDTILGMSLSLSTGQAVKVARNSLDLPIFGILIQIAI